MRGEVRFDMPAPFVRPDNIGKIAAKSRPNRPGDTAMVEEVQRGRGDWERPRRWDRRAHGPRYRYARPGFRHHHGGYYYSSPWWTGPAIGFGLSLPGLSFGLTAPYAHSGLPAAHVQWCMNRYRTYNPVDQFVLRAGRRPGPLPQPVLVRVIHRSQGPSGPWLPAANRWPEGAPALPTLTAAGRRLIKSFDPMPPHPAAFLVCGG
jgi:hypothetical protein